MNRDRGEFVIVQAGSQQLLVLQRKPQRFDQVQLRAGIGTESDDVAGVRRNFRLKENDVEHGWVTGPEGVQPLPLSIESN